MPLHIILLELPHAAQNTVCSETEFCSLKTMEQHTKYTRAYTY